MGCGADSSFKHLLGVLEDSSMGEKTILPMHRPHRSHRLHTFTKFWKGIPDYGQGTVSTCRGRQRGVGRRKEELLFFTNIILEASPTLNDTI